MCLLEPILRVTQPHDTTSIKETYSSWLLSKSQTNVRCLVGKTETKNPMDPRHVFPVMLCPSWGLVRVWKGGYPRLSPSPPLLPPYKALTCCFEPATHLSVSERRQWELRTKARAKQSAFINQSSR